MRRFFIQRRVVVKYEEKKNNGWNLNDLIYFNTDWYFIYWNKSIF